MNKTTIIGIGGNLASGKSYLIRHLLAHRQLGRTRQRAIFKSITVERNPTLKLFAIGRYDDTRYPGTDFMYTPTLEADVITFATTIVPTHYPDHFVIFEGNRLFKSSFINTITHHPALDVTLIMLTVTPDTLFHRHLLRQDNQTITDITANDRRNTNLLKKYPTIIQLPNNTQKDFTTLLERTLHYGHTHH
jgi:hypothetical protein